MPVIKSTLFILWLTFCQSVLALSQAELVPPKAAFTLSAQALNAEQLELNWQIADGFMVYRNNLRIHSKTDAVELGNPLFPVGTIKQDELLGTVEHYHHQLKVTVPYTNQARLSQMHVFVQYQACSEQGVCYPPQKQTLPVSLPLPVIKAASDPLSSLVKSFSGFKTNANSELLPPDQAFQFFASVKNANTLHVNWVIADAYYLYREKVQLALLGADGVELGAYQIPHGTPKVDEAFGQVEIFHNELAFDIPLVRSNKTPFSIKLEAKFQGCADRGVCYPPMSKTLSLALPEITELSQTASNPTPPVISEQDEIVNSLRHDNIAIVIASFFGFGLLLSLTPCIFPMIPILSGIIVGHNKQLSVMRGFMLSLSYVLASALTYAVFGVIAALFGSNLQAFFQQTWIIIAFSSLMVILSLAMFGFYHLELPKSLQAKLHNSSERHRDGSLWGAAIMGALSSLIVGPCVAAPLAGALIFIGQTGDVILGFSALLVMGLGMGVPLLILGASAGKLLPKAGDWLNATKAVFGVIMLAVAIWMLSRVIPAEIAMLLWSLWLILPSIYLSALDPLPPHSSGWRKLFKGIGLVMLVYGLLLLIGFSLGNHNPLAPLQGIGFNKPTQAAGVTFQRVTTLAELNQRIAEASAKQQPVMLDFYADWCISCKEMEAYTFTDATVKQGLAKFLLLQADVTANSDADQALLSHFNLIGPPATLFFDRHGQELSQQRVVGYQDAKTFAQSLSRLSL